VAKKERTVQTEAALTDVVKNWRWMEEMESWQHSQSNFLYWWQARWSD